MLSHSEITETRKERITTYSDKNGGICHMRTMPYGIDFGFLKGAKMENQLNLLTGNGKLIRILQLKELNTDAINYYFDQAINLNIKK